MFLEKAWYGALPVLLLAAGCSFFTLEDESADDDDDDSPMAGSSASGTGGMPPVAGQGGTGGSTAGSSAGGSAGTGGGSAGTGGAGQGGGANAGGDGGTAGAMAGSAGDGAMGGVSGGGTGGAGDGGTAGSGGDAGTGTSGNGGSGGSGGNGPMTCEELNAGAEAFAGHCYLVNMTAVSWSNAQSACMTLGGHLVTISSEGVGQTEFDAENAFVWGLVSNMEVWLGLTDGKQDSEAGDGTPFSWITDEAITLDKWSDGEPNNYQKECPGGGGTCYEHCGFIPGDRNGEWNDDICGMSKPYVCEWDMGG